MLSVWLVCYVFLSGWGYCSIERWKEGSVRFGVFFYYDLVPPDTHCEETLTSPTLDLSLLVGSLEKSCKWAQVPLLILSPGALCSHPTLSAIHYVLDVFVWWACVGGSWTLSQANKCCSPSFLGGAWLSFHSRLVCCPVTSALWWVVGMLRLAEAVYTIQLFFVLRLRPTLQILYIYENVFTSSI